MLMTTTSMQHFESRSYFCVDKLILLFSCVCDRGINVCDLLTKDLICYILHMHMKSNVFEFMP